MPDFQFSNSNIANAFNLSSCCTFRVLLASKRPKKNFLHGNMGLQLYLFKNLIEIYWYQMVYGFLSLLNVHILISENESWNYLRLCSSFSQIAVFFFISTQKSTTHEIKRKWISHHIPFQVIFLFCLYIYFGHVNDESHYVIFGVLSFNEFSKLNCFSFMTAKIEWWTELFPSQFLSENGK